jgi:hypothetical protein
MVTDFGEAIWPHLAAVLAVVGADGLPAIKDAGNVLRPKTALKLSLRLPPLIDGQQATRDMKRILEADPPHGASVTFEPDQGASGWSAPPTAPWLKATLEQASQAHYGRPAAMMGEGGTIPFMAMLGRYFPAAQFLITGVLGRDRMRPQRVPAHRLRAEAHRLRGSGAGGACAALNWGRSYTRPCLPSRRRRYSLRPACRGATNAPLCVTCMSEWAQVAGAPVDVGSTHGQLPRGCVPGSGVGQPLAQLRGVRPNDCARLRTMCIAAAAVFPDFCAA